MTDQFFSESNKKGLLWVLFFIFIFLLLVVCYRYYVHKKCNEDTQCMKDKLLVKVGLLDKLLSTKKNNLVKEDGSRCIPASKERTSDTMMEQDYIESVRAQVKSYDAIMLYIALLEIICLRQNRLYVAEENVDHFNVKFSVTLEDYYYEIRENIAVYGEKTIIPKSLLWNTSELNNPDMLEQRYKNNKKFYIVYN